jgi:hypothetical protein
MSKQYPGGIISKTAPVPSGSFENSTAPGIWTLEQQAAYAKLGQWPTAGNVNPSAFIENLFVPYLYTGTGAAQTITNGMNLSGSGGLVWSKSRSAVQDNSLIDTVRGNGSILYSNIAGAADTGVTTGITAFGTTGYSLGSGSFINQSSQPYVSWTFREQAKFFDIVTWTGNGIAGRQIPHNLGSVPGCIIVKNIELGTNWTVYHRGADATAPQDYEFYLDATNARISSIAWNNTAPTSTYFTVGSGNEVNRASSLNTYVAYVFAHNAGGFGLSGSDNVISCGSYTENASPQDITLGYEPQWLLAKKSSTGGSAWYLFDTMREMNNTDLRYLVPNTTEAEGSFGGGYMRPIATGFTAMPGFFGNGSTVIYMAIRKGPMQVPTVGTTVFSPIQATGSTGTKLTTNFPVDLQIWALTADGGSSKRAVDRLRGVSSNTTTNGTALFTDSTAAEDSASVSTRYFDNTGYTIPGNFLGSGYNAIYWNFRRAPGFFDEVCYAGTGANTNFTHNLGVVPELMITKRRSNTGPWVVYTATTGNTDYLQLYTTDAVQTNTSYYNSTTPTASVFTLGSSTSTNANANTFVAYLFATCPGVSKVGTYTGTGAAQTINCGFTSGSRFVLIKRTDSTGDWYVWDSARGIIPASDPYLFLNTAGAQVTGTDYIDTTSVGFDITSTAPSGINASGGTFIFLAIA